MAILNRKVPEEIEHDYETKYRQQFFERADEGRIIGYKRDPILNDATFSEAELAFLDPQVKACHLITAFSVMNKEIIFVPPKHLTKKTDIRRSQERADFLMYSLRKVKGADVKLRYDLMTSKFFGCAFIEKVYDVLPSTYGRYKNFYYYKRLKARKTGLWRFHFDKKGNVDGFCSGSIYQNKTIYPLNQMMFMSWLPLYDNPYGQGDFISIRKFIKSKWEFIIFVLSLGARQAKGKQSILKGDAGISEGNNSEHQKVLKKLNDYLSVYLPKDYEVEFHKFDTKALEDFLKVLRWLDIQISIAMLSNSMTTNQNEKTGSHAMASAQIEAGTFTFTDYACRNMEDAIDEQYASDLLNLNYDRARYTEETDPICKLVDPENVDLERQTRIDTALKNLGVIDFDTEADLMNRRSLYNLPDNPELFENREESNMSESDFINLVKKIESQLKAGNQISKRLSELLDESDEDSTEEDPSNDLNEDENLDPEEDDLEADEEK